MPFGQGQRLPNAQEMTTRMIQGATNNAEKWLDHTLNPTKNPKQQALKANGKYKARMQESIQQDSWAKGVQGYDEEAAVQAIRNAGTGAYVNGIQSRETKIRGKMEPYLRELGTHVQKLDAMPTDTAQQAEAKMLENLRGMRQIGKNLKGAR